MTRTFADWLSHIERQHPKSVDMGLERVREIADRLHLKRPARHVITVGGTNGKGSTVAFIEAIARAAGMKVGAYTSPHLLAYNERVRVGGADASDAELIAAFEAIEAVRIMSQDAGDQAVPLTYFEYGTLAALWLFERADLDLAILEVGLGGRLDATNLVNPDVAVITTVDIDHQDYLGNDRETIGFEKAGIARDWKPLVLGDDDPPSSVLRHAYAIGASAVRAGCDFFFEPVDAERWRWREVGYELLLPMPGLAAPVQLRNAAVAIAAMRALDVEFSNEALADGVARARIPGRLQRFERDGIEMIVDVGHNPQAARALATWLVASPIAGRTHAVFGALADKDVIGVVEALAPTISSWYLVGLAEHAPRGVDAATFAGMLSATTAGKGAQHADVPQALAAARTAAQQGDRILVFGSFHIAAAALEKLGAD